MDPPKMTRGLTIFEFFQILQLSHESPELVLDVRPQEFRLEAVDRRTEGGG